MKVYQVNNFLKKYSVYMSTLSNVQMTRNLKITNMRGNNLSGWNKGSSQTRREVRKHLLSSFPLWHRRWSSEGGVKHLHQTVSPGGSDRTAPRSKHCRSRSHEQPCPHCAWLLQVSGVTWQTHGISTNWQLVRKTESQAVLRPIKPESAF